MFVRSLGERIVVELDSVDCELLAKACRQAVGTVDGEMAVHSADISGVGMRCDAGTDGRERSFANEDEWSWGRATGPFTASSRHIAPTPSNTVGRVILSAWR